MDGVKIKVLTVVNTADNNIANKQRCKTKNYINIVLLHIIGWLL